MFGCSWSRTSKKTLQYSLGRSSFSTILKGGKFKKVALASCAAAVDKAPDAQREMKSLVDALRFQNVEGEVVPWDKLNERWEEYDGVVLCQTWDYSIQVGKFMDWATGLRTKLLNSHRALKWNVNKRYLLDLEDNDVDIVPSICIDPHQADEMTDALDCISRRDWKSLMIKPLIGCDGEGVEKFDRFGSDAVDHINQIHKLNSGVIIQPFLDSIKTEGEISLIYIDGLFSHAVRKVPNSKDYRVQERFGGSAYPETPSSAMLHVGEKTITALRNIFTSEFSMCAMYARIDLIRMNTTEPKYAVGEVELIEPHLYLLQSAQVEINDTSLPQASVTLAKAISTKLSI